MQELLMYAFYLNMFSMSINIHSSIAFFGDKAFKCFIFALS